MELKNLKELLQMYKKYTITGMAVFATAADYFPCDCI